MTTSGFVAACRIGIALLQAGSPRAQTATATQPITDATRVPFAVIELFTSEGCSSCPPADRLASELVAAARRDGWRVFPLAFHVDYWNRLGWRDPWSDAAYSDRQASYGAVFESRYTPQMVINGADAFVGSDRQRARRGIEAALRQPAETELQLHFEAGSRNAGEPLTVRYTVNPVPLHASLHVALVERGLSSSVARGENRGRLLHHDNVVRAFETTALDRDHPTGQVRVELPKTLIPAQASVIAFVQDEKSRRILGAAALDLESSGTP